MTRLKKVILGVAIVTGVFGLVMFGGGALLDGSINVDVQKRLSAPPVVLFTFLDNAAGLDAWWSVGQEGQPDDVPRMRAKRKSGPENGAGLEVVFVVAGEGEATVMETWRIKSVIPPSSIVYAIDLKGAVSVERTLTLTPDGEGTRVSWSERGAIDRPAYRWMKVFTPPEAFQDNVDRALGALDRAAKSRRAG